MTNTIMKTRVVIVPQNENNLVTMVGTQHEVPSIPVLDKLLMHQVLSHMFNTTKGYIDTLKNASA
jgi:hypothetical protein